MARWLGALRKPGVARVTPLVPGLPRSLGASPLQAGIRRAAGSGRGQVWPQAGHVGAGRHAREAAQTQSGTALWD